MSERMKYEKRHWYPHMMPLDRAIWERFIEKYPDMYDEVEYDVKIGSVPEFVAQDPDPTHRAQAPIYQYKIDVIGHKLGQLDIIELKPNGGLSALGQVAGYRTLYMRDFNPPVIPKAILITDTLRPDMPHAAEQAGVFVVVV